MAFTTVTGSSGTTSLVGTSGIDVATVVTLTDNVFIGGQESDDSITVDLAGPVFFANAFTVNGGAGSDTIRFFDTLINSFVNGDGGTGVAGQDKLDFGVVIGSDIRANEGNDEIDVVTLENSNLNGNAGNDDLDIRNVSASSVYGGQGIDDIKIQFGSGSNFLVNGNKGDDTLLVNGAYTNSSIYGGQGSDKLTAILKDTAFGPDILKSVNGAFLSGDLGDDILNGSTGIDTLNGGDGVDILVGNTGADILTGGVGFDEFTYSSLAQSVLSSATSNTGFDTITDFNPNTIAPPLPRNGDVINLPFTISGIFTTSLTGSDLRTSLAQTLTDNLIIFPAEVGLVNIAGPVSFAGNYLVVNDGVAGYNFAQDAVIKVDSFAGITTQTFV